MQESKTIKDLSQNLCPHQSEQKGFGVGPHNQRGQLSIFLSVIIVALISLLAFIINVGLFVKAKINLQNAVDAAAWSGAAVQARQLTNMAYLNWEMRNTYKEWMMKYYVLGQLSVPWTRPGNALTAPFPADTDNMNFHMKSLTGINRIYDHYNLPTICLHFGAEFNICSTASVPGVPRFESVGIPGVSEHQEAFLNQIVATKSKDCSARTVLNFGIASLWAYGTEKTVFQDSPDIASNRPGAWIQALELGLRMRNLEMLTNRPPLNNGICLNCGDATTVNDLIQQGGNTPLNERPIKAYLSAYRNLGGHEGQSAGQNQNDLKNNFKLYELSPRALDSGNGLGSLLLPPPGGSRAPFDPRQKYYVDLLAYPINFATYFTTFVTTAGTDIGISSEGQCGPSRTALPVPGYLLGFYKNPSVVTYYAVKGETKFVGLFYPFTNDQGITISAYSAAMPFGGRIGPRIFDFNNNANPTAVKPRHNIATSRPYITALRARTPGATYVPGDPIPNNSDFWLENENSTIGGVPGNGEEIKFTIPNLLYNNFDLSKHIGTSDVMEFIDEYVTGGQAPVLPPASEQAGLYSARQFRALAEILGVGTSNNVDAQMIDRGLDFSRAPTLYEAANYMIPTIDEQVDSENFGVVRSNDPRETGALNYHLYAPLVGPNMIFQEVADIQQAVSDYLASNAQAVSVYQQALQDVASTIRAQAQTFKSNDGNGNASAASAADSIYNGALDFSGGCPTNPEGGSIAQKFGHFFSPQSTAACGIVPLYEDFLDYLDKKVQQGSYREYYYGIYAPPNQFPTQTLINSQSQLLTAFAPGPRHGVDADGTPHHPFGLDSDRSALRNFYSVKFIGIQRAMTSGGTLTQSLWNKPFWERASSLSGAALDNDAKAASENSLDSSQLSEFGPRFFF